jgi:hypothetical protein
LENLNQDQSYRSVEIEKSRRVVESRPVCLGLFFSREQRNGSNLIALPAEEKWKHVERYSLVW